MADIVMKAVDWLNTNSGAIIAIGTVAVAAATIVLVGVTIFYAWVTKKMLEENRQMRIDAQKPEIIIYPVVRRRIFPLVNLYVQNIGPGTAYDVKFTTDFSFSLNEEKTLEKAPFLRYGIGCLLPGERRDHNLNDSPGINFDDIVPIELKIVVTYNDSTSKKYKKCFCIKFREYID